MIKAIISILIIPGVLLTSVLLTSASPIRAQQPDAPKAPSPIKLADDEIQKISQASQALDRSEQEMNASVNAQLQVDLGKATCEQKDAAIARVQLANMRVEAARHNKGEVFNRLCAKHGVDPDTHVLSGDGKSIAEIGKDK